MPVRRSLPLGRALALPPNRHLPPRRDYPPPLVRRLGLRGLGGALHPLQKEGCTLNYARTSTAADWPANVSTRVQGGAAKAASSGSVAANTVVIGEGASCACGASVGGQVANDGGHGGERCQVLRQGTLRVRRLQRQVYTRLPTRQRNPREQRDGGGY